MKNEFKMRYLNVIGLFLVTSFLFMSCGSDENSPVGGDDNLPEWNKSKTTSINFISKFSEVALISNDNDYKQVGSYLLLNKVQSIILDRCDVSYAENISNPLLKIAKEQKLIPLFAKNKLTQLGCSGSGILLSHTLSKQDEIKVSEDCFLKSVATYITAKNYPMTLSTISLQSTDHVKSSSSYLKAAAKKGEVIVGTIKKDIYSELEMQLQNDMTSMRLEKIDTNSTYVLFVLTSKSWVLRDSVKENAGALYKVNLQIEQL